MKSNSRATLLPLAALACALIFELAAAQPGRTQSGDSGSQPAAQQNSGGSDNLPAPLPKGKKLMLKDGTFQIAREYSIEGDRVHYWSVERAEWEEIPTDLVDWDATKKAEAEQQQQDQQVEDKLERARRAEETAGVDEIDASLEVKPGIFLPDGFGMFAVANQKVLTMKQDPAVSKRDMGRELERVASGVPVIPSKWHVALPGKRANFRLSTGDPEFWMRTDDQRDPHMVLVEATVKGNDRHLETESSIAALGTHSYKANEFTFESWPMAPGVYRFTMNQKLPPGEYAFLEITADGADLNVWDFGVDPPSDDATPAATPKP